MKKVAIIHPWFPQYRLEFFDQLVHKAADNNVRLDVYYGEPLPEWGQRGDSVSASFATPLPTKFLGFLGRHLVIKSTARLTRNGPYDLLILEQAVRNIETYKLLLRKGEAKIAFWGHGKTYTKNVGGLQEAFKRLLTNRADWFFAYTPGGASSAISNHFDPQRVTIVNNSIDSRRLTASLAKVTAADKRDFRRRHDLTEDIALFIGGLDSAKRLPFLLEAAGKVHLRNPDFRLLVAGNGAESSLIQDFSKKNNWCIYLGALHGEEKALALSVSQVLAIPGRVGLVAVDSFAAGTPIVTTNWRWHAPEFEYLIDGRNAIVTEDNVDSYASALADVLTYRERLLELQSGARGAAQHFTVEKMVDNFWQGIDFALRDKKS